MSKAGLTLGIWLVLVSASCATVCNNPFDSQTIRCQQIVEIFETALISEELSTFHLRERFFPSEEYPSAVIQVAYSILVNGEIYTRIGSWCKNSVFTVINPVQLQAMFPMLEDTINRGLDIYRHIPKLTLLFLDINDTLNLTDDEIDYAISYITPWVS